MRGKGLGLVACTFACVSVAMVVAGVSGCGGRTGLAIVELASHPGQSADGSTSVVCADGGRCIQTSPRCPLGDDCTDPTPPSSPPPPPKSSCIPDGPGRTDCGAAVESCCASTEVTGGVFARTYVNDGRGPSRQGDSATVSTFALDKYDVTVGRFRGFVAAWVGGWRPTEGSGKHTFLNDGRGLAGVAANGDQRSPGDEPGWSPGYDGRVTPTTERLGSCDPYSTWSDLAGRFENSPITCVDWYEAYAFCIWDGGWLPSEAEWEYAAAGGSLEREYPWGSTEPGTQRQYAIYDEDEVVSGASGVFPTVGSTTLGAGAFGQFDLAGELFQWTLDGYAPYADPCVDCANFASVDDRAMRGGGFFSPLAQLMPPFRDYAAPSSRSDNIGFRCSRGP